jgi:hypothetical protein
MISSCFKVMRSLAMMFSGLVMNRVFVFCRHEKISIG